MRDPYLYEDVPVLKNKLGITEQDLLNDAEADYVVYRLKDLAINLLPGDYHTDHFLKMHFIIFQDIVVSLLMKKDLGLIENYLNKMQVMLEQL